MARKPPPLTSFGPELMETLRKAGTGKVELNFETFSLASRFQQRIYQLRNAMRAHDHPDYPLASRVTSSLLWGKKAGFKDDPETRVNKRNVVHPVANAPCKLIFYPRDSEFGDVLAKANIKVEPISTSSPANGTRDDNDLSFLDQYINSDVKKSP